MLHINSLMLLVLKLLIIRHLFYPPRQIYLPDFYFFSKSPYYISHPIKSLFTILGYYPSFIPTAITYSGAFILLQALDHFFYNNAISKAELVFNPFSSFYRHRRRLASPYRHHVSHSHYTVCDGVTVMTVKSLTFRHGFTILNKLITCPNF